MESRYIHNEDLGVNIELRAFTPDDGVGEWHVMMHVEPRGDLFELQMKRLEKAERQLLSEVCMQGAKPVFKRYFLSDSANQQQHINSNDDCTISYIQQPPLDGSKIAVWMYLQRGTVISNKADTMGSTVVTHNGYRHIWTMGMTSSQGDSYEQTATLLEDYESMLAQHNANITDHCLRTWFFVRDVDTQYHGLVVARRENFEKNGLTPSTHYISSTGIGGNPSDTKALIQLGAYAITGFKPGQQRYLHALTHLNRTIEYGVTFERGTLFEYGDRAHAYISGTASIDNKGNVVHVGNIRLQTQRMLENVKALLNEGGMTMTDVMQVIVYLRDIGDYNLVHTLMNEQLNGIPYVITLAPVCRPTWLIEMECIAVQERRNSNYNSF